MANCNGWTLLKIIEVLLALSCLVCKRVTDDETRSLFLYLQKLSREWSLLNNVTWDRVGSSVADTTFGGYLIITSVLLIGNILGELPTEKRIVELVFLGVGSILFIVIGSLCFAAIDSVPADLIDNAAVLGTLSLVTGALFLLDMGSPKAKKSSAPIEKQGKNGFDNSNNGNQQSIIDQLHNLEREIDRSERAIDIGDEADERTNGKNGKNKILNGVTNDRYKNGIAPTRPDPTSTFKDPVFSSKSYIHLDPTSRGYKPMKSEELNSSRRFGIYGKDVTDAGSETDETASIPPNIELHSPVWSQIRKGTATKYVVPSVVPPQNSYAEVFEKPSGPLDPGYVQYTAQHWGDMKNSGTKTPRHSPTEV
ncbi:uncharacterized protein LOC143204775 isoform X1 [Rhynchophorus ferrugineus]|uniref:uncharacterized protein LOC143204775 isoform X1 n=1 Tax=Rhynchophorus ferrugineus TaxID=354439 RepID=UPI003FCC59FC